LAVGHRPPPLVGRGAIVAERYIKVAILHRLDRKVQKDVLYTSRRRFRVNSCWTVFAGISLVLADFVVGLFGGSRPFIEEAIKLCQLS